MADNFTDIFLHLVWATWDREPFLVGDVRSVAYRCILAATRNARCPAVAIGGIEDHVHVLVRFATTISVADLVKSMKGTSSLAVNQECPEVARRFRWQGTYGAFAVERDSILRITRYIERQEEHHTSRTDDPYLESMYVVRDPTPSHHDPAEPPSG